MRLGVIYIATNLINGDFYIGKDIEWPNRRYRHMYNSSHKNVSDYNVYFHRAIRKYGFVNFKWEILYCNVPEYQLDIAEICAIYTFEPQYNLTLGGDGTLGMVMTNEHKFKISRSLRNKKKTLQHVVKVAEANRGQIRTKESRINISIAHGGKLFDVYKKDTGKFVGSWINQTECARELQCNSAHIACCLLNRYGRRSDHGYVFVYRNLIEKE